MKFSYLNDIELYMGSNKLSDKLLRVERTVNVYRNENDELLQEVNVDVIPFETLKEIVPPDKDDPEMFEGYRLTADQLNKINTYLIEEIVPDFNLYVYILFCAGIYREDNKI